MLYLIISKGGPLREREQQAKADGHKDHFIKKYTYMCVFFKAVALSVSTAVHSLLPPHNLDVPPCSIDTGLWSFKAITMALKQALN